MPTSINAELFGDQQHNAVIRLPGRAFPGVLIQGDTLASLVGLIRETEGLLPSHASPDLIDHLDELRQRLESTLAAYEDAMSNAGMELPYPKPLTLAAGE